ncbi:MAG TPA: hypothetical protein VHO69_05725 [Phototrophicaceae bacterium]|nr:hypothetical protein [Phototrophicaceae bacterium]
MSTFKITLEAETAADLEAALTWLTEAGAIMLEVTRPRQNPNADGCRTFAVLSTPSDPKTPCRQVETAQRLYREFVADGNELAATYWSNVVNTLERKCEHPG